MPAVWWYRKGTKKERGIAKRRKQKKREPQHPIRDGRPSVFRYRVLLVAWWE